MNIFTSIVIYKHSYNDLKLTLDSLLQVREIKKIILVDNDQSSWASTLHNERIVYIRTKGNFGFGYGHNIAIKQFASESDFFLICNPDIHFSLSEFNKLFNFVTTRKEGLFLPKIIYPNGLNQYGARLLPTPINLFIRRFSPKLAEKFDEKYLLKKFDLSKPIFVPYLSGSFMLFRSECLIQLNGFDERFFMYMEDIDISRRCAERFGNIYYPLAEVIHIHEQASYKNKVLLKAHLKSAFQYFCKWGWFYDRIGKSLNARCLDEISNM